MVSIGDPNMKEDSKQSHGVDNVLEKYPRSKILEAKQISMIDEALNSVGEYGEVRLVVEKGRLRFVVTNKSYDVLKWHSGSIR
jgi:hypothetical protein